jgi:hypothetical protein
MGYGFTTVAGKSVPFGFYNVEDWFDSIITSFPAPWEIGEDTNYGTQIIDADGLLILSVWMAFGLPSKRQLGGMTDAEWSDYCCDSHWESETQWHIANAIVTARNSIHIHETRGWFGNPLEQVGPILRTLIMQWGRWEEDINEEIVCGGPQRRMADDDPQLLKDNPSLRRHRSAPPKKRRPKTLPAPE